ncbi:SusD family protein [bacterium A37T11]|nr:SusD family protein [bacterium A37T11]
MNIRINVLILCGCLVSCNSYLDAVPDRSLAILTTLEQYEQLINGDLYAQAPALQELGIDDYYVPFSVWQSKDIRLQNAYIWKADIYDGNSGSGVTQDWNAPYGKIYYCNVVLEGLESLSGSHESAAFREVKGHALFFRAYQHYLLQEVYGQPYRPATANMDLGIPLKYTSLPTERIFRSTVAKTFASIILDSEKALEMLPEDYQAVNKVRASKAAVCAFLSRVYLTMQNYQQSLAYADQCLSYYVQLLDYNQLYPDYRFGYPDNQEVVFSVNASGTSGVFLNTGIFVDSLLYPLYADHDLRKQVFFLQDATTGLPHFKSMYSGDSNPFAGLALDEVYLNRAECRARLGDEDGALADLNELLIHRYETGYYFPLTRESAGNTLQAVLKERRKEMVVRCTRWTDLRRLNQDPALATTLRRSLNGTDYELLPNSPRYTYPIPPKEAAISQLPQNQR